MKTSCGINKYYILLICFCVLDGCFRNINRVLFITHGKDFYSLLLSIDLKLCDRSRTINVTGNQKRSSAFGF